VTAIGQTALVVNGVSAEAVVDPRWTLADYLRDGLGLTGTHIGCEHGVCGACTVLVDGRATRACLVFAVQLDGHEIQTVEGLAGRDGSLSDLQEEFARHRAFQCGFCTPGFLMLAASLLAEPEPVSDERIEEVLGSNLCRCTGYHPILDAVKAARDRRGGRA
jgi:carbon-monoxide dehydrogenase small subunit